MQRTSSIHVGFFRVNTVSDGLWDKGVVRWTFRNGLLSTAEVVAST